MADDAEAKPDTADETPAAPKAKGGMLVPLLLGMNLALVLGGGAAFAIMSGAIAPPPIVADLLGVAPEDGDAAEEGGDADVETADAGDGGDADPTGPPDMGELAFVPLEQLTVTLTRSGARRQLRVMVVIETAPVHAPAIDGLRPRIRDALNTLLRAVDEEDLSDPAAFDRLRAQLLRRVRISVDPALVRDLLITEYVIF